MKMKRVLLPFLALAFLFSCQEEGPQEPPAPSGPAIVLDSGQNRNVTLDKEGGSVTVSFTSSGNWTAGMVNTRADSWISVSPTSGGAGKNSVKVTALSNDGFEDRNATLKILAGNVSESIVFTQKQKDAITLASDKVEVDASGGVVTINLKSNIDFKYQVAEDCSAWIKPVSTRSYDSHSVQFAVSGNLELTPREGSVIFTGGGISETVRFYQAASEPRIIITGKDYVVESEGGGVTIEVGSNVSVSMTIPEDVSWLREESTRSFSTNTFNLVADPNPDPEDRIAVITFRNEENGLSEEVTITQKQKDTITLSSGGEVEIGAEGGVIGIELKSNVDFNVSIDESCSSWIKAFGTRSYDSYSLQFIVSANEELSSREGSITFVGESVHETVLVRQEGAAPVITIGRKEFEIPSGGGDVSVEVTTNIPVTVEVPDSVAWIHYSSRALSTGIYEFSVDSNPEPDDRMVEILFKNEEHGLSATVSILQKQDDQINLASEEVKVSYLGGTFEISLESNVEYKVTSDAEWLKETKTRGLVSHTHAFAADPLPEDEFVRNSALSFTDASGHLVRTVNVIQEDDSNIITFKDESAKQVCVERFDRNSDGELSEREAAHVTSFENVMTNNTDITSFDEFVYFTGLSEVSPSAFRGCRNLQRVTLPPNITSIGDNSFNGCSSLRKVDCQGLLKNIGDYAFYWCSSLGEMTISADKLTIGNYAFYACGALTRFSVSGEVASIGDYAFFQSISLRRFECLSVMPPSCGNRPFGSTELDRGWIIVPKGSVETYRTGDYWRDFSEGIISSEQADSPIIDFKDMETKAICVENFDRDADGELSEFEASVVSSLRRVINYNDKITSFDEFVYFTGISEIPDYDIQSCPNLRSVTLPPSITSIGDYCFMLCVSLERVVIPEGVTKIGEYAFHSCEALKSLTISSTVERMDDGAFSSCPALEHIELLSRVPPEIVGSCFYRTGEQYIYVPDGTASDYQETECWRRFRARITEKGHKPFEFLYVSTDYSHDGELVCLQKASKGKGIELVFLGDGYLDRDMAPGGKYEAIMRRWLEQLFVYEPLKSFREWFTIYTIKVVSRHDAFGSTDFERRLTEDITDGSGEFGNEIKVLYEPVREYLAKALPSGDPSSHRVVVFMNTETSVGRSFCSYGGDDYCRAWIFDSIDRRPTTLNHELGHGLGWLADEYVEYDSACPDPEKFSKTAANIDWLSDPSKVKWSRFLRDSRYANEGLGVFKGAFYAYGLYRPTENGMMRNDLQKGAVFSAPCREQLYKNIMRWGNGSGWVYDYETFVKYDEAGRKQAADAYSGIDISGGLVSTRNDAARESETLPGLPPIVTDKEIKEVIVSKDGRVEVKYR